MFFFSFLVLLFVFFFFFFFMQKTAYEMRISDWSSDVCSSDLAEIGEVGVVHLQVAAAARRQVGDLGAIGGREVGIEVFEVRIDLLRDRLAAAAEMQHGGRGNADLRRFRYHAGEEVVVGTLDWPGVADRRLDVHGRRAKADLAAVVPAEGGGELAVSDGEDRKSTRLNSSH